MHSYRKFVIPALGALVGLFLTSTVAMAQASETETHNMTARAELVAPIALAVTTNMNFGSIVKSTGVSTVSLEASAAATRAIETGDAALSAETPPVAGQFAVTGEPEKEFAITFDADHIDLTGPGDAMVIGTLIVAGTEVTDGAASSGGTATLSAGGARTFYLGGTLTMAAAQTSGEYTGDFDVTVTYN